MIWFVWLGFSTVWGLSGGIPIIIYIVTKYFEANDNVGGIGAAVLGLILAINVIFSIIKGVKSLNRRMRYD